MKHKQCIILLVLVNLSLHFQAMPQKYKKLSKAEFRNYLIVNKGEFVANPYLHFCNFYEFQNNILVVENIPEKTYTIYFDRSGYYEEMNRIRQAQKESPLKEQQEYIVDFKSNKDRLLDNLFNALGLVKPTSLALSNLAELDEKIKKFGKDRAFNELYLNLILFCW